MNPKIKPYRAPSRLSCTLKGDCIRGLKENANAECITCPKCLIEILDLEKKVVASM